MLITFENPLVRDLLVDITYHDSGEEPEKDSTNTMVSFKLGKEVYQYFNTDVNIAIERFKSTLTAQCKLCPFTLPSICFAVVTRFKSNYIINWHLIEQAYERSKARNINTTAHLDNTTRSN